MTTPGPATEPLAREAPRELLALACAIRPDWLRDEVWNSIHAARTAGLPWARIVTRLVDIALREEEPATRPQELWDYARGITSKATGVPPAADYLAVKAARGWGSGEMQKLTEANDPGAGTVPVPEVTETRK